MDSTLSHISQRRLKIIQRFWGAWTTKAVVTRSEDVPKEVPARQRKERQQRERQDKTGTVRASCQVAEMFNEHALSSVEKSVLSCRGVDGFCRSLERLTKYVCTIEPSPTVNTDGSPSVAQTHYVINLVYCSR